MQRTDYILLAWLCMSTIFLVLSDYFSVPRSYRFVYLVGWVWIIGTLVLIHQERLRQIFRTWPLRPVYTFFLLCFGAVLLEEVLAALINHLTEGFELTTFIIRIGQFWAFNVIAFSGFIVGWYVLLKYIRFSSREVFFLGGLWGLYAERTYSIALSNPLAFILFTAPTVLTYAIVLYPAYLSLPLGRHTMHPVYKYPLALLVIFVASILPFIILTLLREHFPFIFPPRIFIP